MANTSSDGFYVTLPSNASGSLFKNNKVGCYTVDLAQAIDLSGEWVVGLCEIRYPRTWYSLRSQDAHFYARKILNDIRREPSPITKMSFTHSHAYYSRPEDLTRDITSCLRTLDPNAGVEFDDVSRSVLFTGSSDYLISIPAPLCYMLGVPPDSWKTLNSHRAPFPVDLNAGLYNLFVYTDIIQYQAVGDSYSPLLGLVEVAGKFGETVNIRYNRIHYVPLARNHIKTIRIEIKSDLNSCVDFSYGKVIVKLHFKPAHLPL